jgi:queuine tRNA-ribosyltransferase
LIAAKEMLSATLLSIHNLHTLLQIAHGLRQAVLDSVLDQYAAAFFAARQSATDQD